MVDYKQKQLEKERVKALCDLLVAECKSPHPNLDSVRTILNSGADIHYKYAEPMRWATKLNHFELVKFLIGNGALNTEIARSYISKMCDHKFSDKIEPQFFEILDIARANAGGDYMTLFTPYINHMAVYGKIEKLRALQTRYYLTEAEIASVIEVRIIFEIVLNNHDEMLNFVERHKKWISQESFDSAVSAGEWIVLEYMVHKNGFLTPSDAAVAKAVYDGYFEVLDILTHNGYKFERKALFLEKACCAAFSKGTRSLEYLLRHGYSVSDIYRGKTLFEHADEDQNEPLLRFLKNSAG